MWSLPEQAQALHAIHQAGDEYLDYMAASGRFAEEHSMEMDGLIESKKFLREMRETFYTDKLQDSKRYARIILLAVSLFSMLLLFPDMTIVSNAAARASIVVGRSIFSLALIALFFFMKQVKTFQVYACLVTATELVAGLNFMFVLTQYGQPDFLIQAMGLLTIIIAIFIVPNRWAYMLLVTLTTAIEFIVYSAIFINIGNPMQFWSATVYITTTVLLCTAFAYHAYKYEFREYVANNRLQRMALSDQLTQTGNRYKLEQEAGRWIAFCRRQSFPLSLMMIDVDDLKTVNDRYGHLAGDSVLVELAKLINNHVRGTDLLVRWGGDEFVLLLPNTSLENAIGLTERIRHTICGHVFVEGSSITCSFGIVTMKQSSSFNSLIDDADRLMYMGKRYGKNYVQWDESV